MSTFHKHWISFQRQLRKVTFLWARHIYSEIYYNSKSLIKIKETNISKIWISMTSGSKVLLKHSLNLVLFRNQKKKKMRNSISNLKYWKAGRMIIRLKVMINAKINTIRNYNRKMIKRSNYYMSRMLLRSKVRLRKRIKVKLSNKHFWICRRRQILRK